MSQNINVQYYVEVELQQGCNFMYYHLVTQDGTVIQLYLLFKQASY